jgi:phenylalanyl-tRNA synthetase beta chain
MKVVHSWLGEYLGKDLPETSKLEDLMNFHTFEVEGIEEIEGETVIDLDVLPNRASDCLCHRGIAREIATLLDIDLEKDPLTEPVVLQSTKAFEISIEDETACPRFTASLISKIKVKDSPEWLQKKLKTLGQRPINNIVDATNYVMYSIGQPLHAYDADLFPRVDGKWQFGVRFAKEGEEVSLLAEGGKDEDRLVTLKGTELLVVDNSTNTPIGLAGVKGGKFAGVHAGTENIIIEAAHFHPTVTRKTARRLGIVIDASKRFENEPSRELLPFAQRDVVKLITDIAGGTYEGTVDEYLIKKQLVRTEVKFNNVNRLLGLGLNSDEIISYIERTGAKVVESNDKSFVAESPFERTDLNIEADYIEEVGRIHGLLNIDSVVPEKRDIKVLNSRHYYSDLLRNKLIELGYSEVITSSFQKKGKLQLRNALASDKSYLRDSLNKNINKVLAANYPHLDLLGIQVVKVFEIGTVFINVDNKITEKTVLSIGVRTKGNGYNPKDDKELNEALEVVKETLGTSLDWEIEQGVAEINLSEIIAKLPVPTQYTKVEEKSPTEFKAISQFPAIARDIALWVNEGEEAKVVIKTLVKSAGDMCVHNTLFDTFTKDGRTSYAFRLVFQSNHRTLTDTEVNEIMEYLYKLSAELSWEVR